LVCERALSFSGDVGELGFSDEGLGLQQDKAVQGDDAREFGFRVFEWAILVSDLLLA